MPHIALPDSKIKVLPEGFKPSPMAVVRTSDNTLVMMNRRERRHRHIYGNAMKARRHPNPPAVFHSPEEAKESQ